MNVCFAWFSQMMNFWIDDTQCLVLFIYLLEFDPFYKVFTFHFCKFWILTSGKKIKVSILHSFSVGFNNCFSRLLIYVRSTQLGCRINVMTYSIPEARFLRLYLVVCCSSELLSCLCTFLPENNFDQLKLSIERLIKLFSARYIRLDARRVLQNMCWFCYQLFETIRGLKKI